MRERAFVICGIWASEDFQALGTEARLLAFYQLTSPYSNMAGVYRLTNGMVMDDLKWSSDTLSNGLRELHHRGFSTRCARTSWLIIHNYLKWNLVKGPKQCEGLVKVVRTLPRGAAISEAVWKAITQFVHDLSPEQLLAVKTHLEPKTDANTLPLALTFDRVPHTPSIQGEGEGEGSEKVKAGPPPSAKPPREEGEKTTAALAFDQYASAFGKRYKTQPLVNAKVRGQFTELVKRVGEAAPHVAAFYVSMDRKVYADSTHSVDLLVRDVEGIHAQWRAKNFPDLSLGDWWKTDQGIKARGKALGVRGEENDTWNMYVARVYLAAGEGDHLTKADPGVRQWMETFRQEQPA